MPNNQLIHIGTIVRPHGVHGQVKVELLVPIELAPDTLVWIGYNTSGAREFIVESAMRHGRRCMLKLSTVTTRQQAETLREYGVFVPASLIRNAEQLSNPDIIGWNVCEADTDKLIGKVEELHDNPAHTLLKIRCLNGAEALVPYVQEFIKRQDLSARTLWLSAPEGLLPDQLFSANS